MPKKQNGFGNAKSLAFKPSKNINKGKAQVPLATIQVVGDMARLYIEALSRSMTLIVTGSNGVRVMNITTVLLGIS